MNRNNSSFTDRTILQIFMTPKEIFGSGFYPCLCSKIHIFEKSGDLRYLYAKKKKRAIF